MTFTSPHDAVDHVRHHPVDLVISDYRMPEMDGATFLAMVKKLNPDAARIMLSAFTDLDGIVRAINDAGIFRFVAKAVVRLPICVHRSSRCWNIGI